MRWHALSKTIHLANDGELQKMYVGMQHVTIDSRLRTILWNATTYVYDCKTVILTRDTLGLLKNSIRQR
jgi:hypothetical protein